ncbi:MAG: hypothetical protein K2N01_02045 [Lachnospiraceae bacterium]|nr:hypothetical protein [Lachnospiraceae bacterium]
MKKIDLLGNWEYIQMAFHDKHVLGCGTMEGDRVIDMVNHRRNKNWEKERQAGSVV